MDEALQQVYDVLQLSFSNGHWWLLIAALVVTIFIRVVFWKLFKFAMNVVFFLLIYVLVILGFNFLML